MLLVVVDAHSKWLEVRVASAASSAVTVRLLRQIFVTHGLPRTIVSDNGSCFTSIEFQEFLSNNGVRHARTSPYHPSSNGLAERAVQTLKVSLSRQASTLPFDLRLNKFLLNYRITPHTTTGQAPCELLMGRRLRTRLDLVIPDMEADMTHRQEKQAQLAGGKVREFAVGASVYVRNYSDRVGERWVHGYVVERTGPVSYGVATESGIRRCHVDQMFRCVVKEPIDQNVAKDPKPLTNTESEEGEEQFGEVSQDDGTAKGFCLSGQPSPSPTSTESVAGDTLDQETSGDTNPGEDSIVEITNPGGDSTVEMTPALRRSSRVTRPPDRLTY